jgi:hypothetical protein
LLGLLLAISLRLRSNTPDEMNIIGSNNIGFASQRDFCFDVDVSFADLGGESSFSFSGGVNSFEVFKFKDSRVFDYQNRFIYSYFPNQALNISGAYQSGKISYAIDGTTICGSDGLCSSSVAFDNLLFRSSNDNMSVFPNLYISSVPDVDMEFPYDSPLSGNDVTGVLKNNSADSWNSFKIFSAEASAYPHHYHLNTNLTGQVIPGGGQLNFVLGFDGNSSFSLNSSKRVDPITSQIDFSTNFGEFSLSKDFELLASPYYASSFELNQIIPSGNFISWNFDILRQACSGTSFEFRLEPDPWTLDPSGYFFSNSFVIYSGCSVDGNQLGLSGLIPYSFPDSSYRGVGFMTDVGCNDDSLLRYNFVVKYVNDFPMAPSNIKYSISGIGEPSLYFSGNLD